MFWNVRPIPSSVTACGGLRVMSVPSNTMRPAVGLYTPVNMLKKVVFPAPFGPIRLTIELCGIVKSMSLTATRPPNSLRMSDATRMSVIPRIPVGVRPFVLDVVEGRVAHALLELSFVPAFGDQPRGPEEHDQHDDQPVDPEVVLRHVLDADLGPDLRQAFLIEVREQQSADDRPPHAPHPAEDHHAEDE